MLLYAWNRPDAARSLKHVNSANDLSIVQLRVHTQLRPAPFWCVALAVEHVLDVYVVRGPTEAEQFVFISSLHCWYGWCTLVIHVLAPFVYDTGEEV